MKKILTNILLATLLIVCTNDLLAQTVPKGFNFQSVARDEAGNIITNSDLGVKISVVKGTEAGDEVYTETHTAATDHVGLFQLVIGEGSSEDDFNAITWVDDNYFIKFAVDPSGGTEFEELGITRLLSVPYARVAQQVIDGISAGEEVITQYTLNSSQGDTSFTINAHGSQELGGALKVKSETDGSNRGIDSRVYSSAGNESSQIGVYGRAEGSGTAAHYGLYGVAMGEEGITGSRYGTRGWGEGYGRYNYGVQGIARGAGDGTYVPLGEGPTEDFFGSFNIAGGFYSSGNSNGNVGVEGVAQGDQGERVHFGVIGSARGTANSPNIGMRAEAFNSPELNLAFDGEANGDSDNIGLRLNVHSGVSNIGMEINAETAAILNGNLTTNGELTVNGNIEYSGDLNQVSDRKLKENIAPLKNALGTIMQLAPKTYNFRGDEEYDGMKLSPGLHFGLIAQEVESVFPSLIKNNTYIYSETVADDYGPDSFHGKVAERTIDYKTLNYMELVPVLIKAVQEQQEEIEALKNEIDQLTIK